MRSRVETHGPTVLLGHLGATPLAPLTAVLAVPETDPITTGAAEGSWTAAMVRDADGVQVGIGVVGALRPVPGWSGGRYARIHFDRPKPGRYRVECRSSTTGLHASEPFDVEPDVVQRRTMSDILSYFKAMRSSGEIDRKDRSALRWGEATGFTVDARGGWLDASGDTSKFLSHLTYTAMMSPQQIPLCVWAMAEARDAVHDQHPALEWSLSTRLRDEALWGADFLVRFRAPEGYFYTGIFDALLKQLDERVVTAPLPECVRTDRYQAAYRQGGGLAIAALARAAGFDDDGDFTRAEYLQAAVSGFDHLEQHNLDYLDDGVESIVDDYCALLAAAELATALAAAGRPADHRRALEAAERRAATLAARYVDGGEEPGWFVGDHTGRPFFHAVEAGLPVVALLRFAKLHPEAAGAVEARALAVRVMSDHLDRAGAVHNPFGYPRQRVLPNGGAPHDAFFFPHANDTGYWWQGENANISSLSVAASACAALDDLPDGLRERLLAFAEDQVEWVLGRNPFDASMLQGRGRGNVDYASDFPNLPGGIVNGITSGWVDEADIAFVPESAADGEEWRWAEQWIPHTGWFLLAVASVR